MGDWIGIMKIERKKNMGVFFERLALKIKNALIH